MIAAPSQRCTKCARVLPTTAFFTKRAGGGRVRPYRHCKGCHRAYVVAWIARNPKRAAAIDQRAAAIAKARRAARSARRRIRCRTCGTRLPMSGRPGRPRLFCARHRAMGKQ